MHAFRSYIFSSWIACDSGPTCLLRYEYAPVICNGKIIQIILDNVYSHSGVAEKPELSLCVPFYCCILWAPLNYMVPFASCSPFSPIQGVSSLSHEPFHLREAPDLVCAGSTTDKQKSKQRRHNKQLSYRRETALQGGLVIAKSEKLELGDNIYGHYRLGLYSTTVTYLASKEIEIGEKKTQK